MLEVVTLAIPDVKLVKPRKFLDARGFFSETYSRETSSAIGIDVEFVQDNHSLSVDPGTVRGLHFQNPPHVQAKLVRVARGSVFDVAVDLRRNSASYGRYVAATLSSENWHQLFVPAGFAHGFCTLEPNTELLYKVTDYYAPSADAAIKWDDPDLAIAWPEIAGSVVSAKDQAAPPLKGFQSAF